MTNLDIAHRRLYNQQLAQQRFEKPEDVVGWLGAVQSQDYAGAKWAVGQRVPGAVDEDLEKAFTEGAILRTHLLRPTWHFVLPTDIRWMLTATAPRVNALSAYYYRQHGLDDAVFARTNDLIARALEGGKQLTRPELMSALEQGGIDPGNGIRRSYIVIRAELDAVICSGARRGKQFTYALLDERAPKRRTLERDEAVAELVRRYFTSHGPATVQDLIWWSSLTVAEAKAGIEMVKSELEQEVIEGRTYWSSSSTPTVPPTKESSPVAYLLPNYDEYISYKDRSAMSDDAHGGRMDPEKNIVFPHMIIMDGRMVGTWKRTLTKSAVVIETSLFRSLAMAEMDALEDAVERYGQFLGLAAVMQGG